MSLRGKKHRKAKIICTIGPSSDSDDTVAALIKSGMNVARLNFSHGDHHAHRAAHGRIRKMAERFRMPVAILQDLQGVKIRVGRLHGGAVALKKGSTVSLMPGEGIGDQERIYIAYPQLLRDIGKGARILLDDGLIQLSVIARERDRLRAKVIEGGILRDRKGVNFPGMKLSVKSFTEKDERDLSFGLDVGIDCVAISFVREAGDVTVVRDWLRKRGVDIPVIAKIEKPEALQNIDSILSVVDGIMIARGDLGVEIPPEEVPLIQKGLIKKANTMGKVVITATQMLESMTEHLRPTRAEATDVANAVLDGTDALMLSAETAVGKHPVEALKMMDRIIRHTESLVPGQSPYIGGGTFAEATVDAACRAAEDMKARVIAAFTQSGFTARLLSKSRPTVPVVVFTPNEIIRNRVCLFWGITPKIMKLPATTDEMIAEVERLLLQDRIVKKGDSIVITASSPLSTQGKTNFLKLHRVGE